MAKHLAKVFVRGRNKDGVPSYAIGLTKQDMQALDLQNGENKVWIDDTHVRHGLSIRSKYWEDYCQRKSSLSEMFDKFWQEHPEITDHKAYLKSFWDEQLKQNEEDDQ